MMLALVILMSCLMLGYGQQNPTEEFCIDLFPQSNVTVNKLIGTWFGVEVITHRDRVTGERSPSDCIFVVISEITHEMATMRPLENNKEIVTQFGPQSLSAKSFKDYRYLKLDWTELNIKNEYIIRYNVSRSGFWMSSAPHEPAQYSDQYNMGAFAGTIQVMEFNPNYLVLTFCERIPRQELFSIILSRQPNSIAADQITRFHDKLREKNLHNLAYRKVCNGVDTINVSYVLAVTVSIMFSLHSKWAQLYSKGL